MARESLTTRILLNALTLTAVVCPLLLSGPLALYAANFTHFDAGVIELALAIAPIALGIIALSIPFSLLPCQAILRTLGLWLALGLYIQGNLLLWEYGPFDGREIPWGDYRGRAVVDCGIWLTLLIVIFIYRHWIAANMARLALCLLVVEMGTSVYSFVTSDAPLKGKMPNAQDAAIQTFSKERNVLIILLDEFSSRGFYELLQRDPSLKGRFRDFTFYRDFISAYPTTFPALPSLLTGMNPPSQGSMKQYFEAAAPFAINEQLATKGWDTATVTDHPLCRGFKRSQCSSLEKVTVKTSGDLVSRQAKRLLDLSLFRHAPHPIKPTIFNEDRWLLQSWDLPRQPVANPKRTQVKYTLTNQQETAVKFLRSFATDMTNNSPRPTFKFLHILIPHSPYTMTSSCEPYAGARVSAPNRFLNNALCALSLVEGILQKMRELQVYDPSTVVLIADHGTAHSFDFPSFGKPMDKPMRRAFPLLLIKPPYRNVPGATEMANDSQPRSQLDVPQILNEVSSLGLVIPPNNARNQNGHRLFHTYKWDWDTMNWSSDSLPETTTFEVRGDSWDMNNWSPAPTTPQQ